LAVSSVQAKSLVLDKATPVYFIGVGGIGMSGLARVLLEEGFSVSGSDAKENQYTRMLRELGGQIYIGHDEKNVPPQAVVILSTAIQEDNPEIQRARQLGLGLYHRSDLLREILKRYPVAIGLTGTHGKTTMTGMTGMVLETGGLDPTIIAGGKILELKTNAKTGKSQYAVAELDESDGTVVQYQPKISVIANLELDHPDHFQDGLKEIIQMFDQYLSVLSHENTVLFNMDCPVTRQLYETHHSHLDGIQVYPGSEPENSDAYWFQNVTLHAEGGYQGDLYEGQTCLGTLWLQIPGRHNLTNAMFAAIIGHRLGIAFEDIRKAIENFSGMGRRFERLGTVQGARIIDDYAHHPTEVAATLKGGQEFNRYGGGRVIAVFQPHRYQRLKALWDEFSQAFDDADEVIVVDVYSAGEAPIEGIDSRHFVEALHHHAKDYWPSSDWTLVLARLKTILTPGDLVITMGAGDITQLGRTLVAES